MWRGSPEESAFVLGNSHGVWMDLHNIGMGLIFSLTGNCSAVRIGTQTFSRPWTQSGVCRDCSSPSKDQLNLKKVIPLEQCVTLQQINSRAAAPWVDRLDMVFWGQRWSFLCQGMDEQNPGVFPWFLFLEIEKGKSCKCSPSWSTSCFVLEWSSTCCARASLSLILSGHDLQE